MTRYVIQISTEELLGMNREQALEFLLSKHRLSPLCALCQSEFITEIKLWIRDGLDNVIYGVCNTCRILPDAEEKLELLIGQES